MLDRVTNNLNGSTSDTFYHEGDLEANNFDFGNNLNSFADQTIIISGNGNLEYGTGAYDTLDFSAYSVDNVIEFDFAEIDSGGEIVSFENSGRIFDSLTLNNGSQILFENIDRLVFSDRTIDLTITPNDPGYSQQWNLHMLGVHNAWRLTTGSEEVLVAIQDSGLGVNNANEIHPDLHLEYYYDEENLADDFFHNNRGANYGIQNGSHGTSVQGIIAANSNNGEGIAGISWGSQLYQIDVIDNNIGDLGFIPATQSAIDAAQSENQNLVVNLSLGESTFNTLGVSALELETMVVSNPGVLFVIAAGNSGHLEEYGLDSPAILAKYYDNVIAVGASWGSEDINGNPVTPGTRIEYPQIWGSQYGRGLTVTAPSEVLTTEALRNGSFDYNPTFDGTSAAAPHVSGVASLIWSANPDLSAIEVKDIIARTAHDLGREGYDVEYGYGLVNADAAVREAIALGREENNFEDIGGSITDRIDEMFETFQDRFPDVDIDEIYDEIYDEYETIYDPSLFDSNQNNTTLLLSSTNSNSNSTSLITDDVADLNLNSADVQFFEELDNYSLGASVFNSGNQNEIDIISFNHDVFTENSNDVINTLNFSAEI